MAERQEAAYKYHKVWKTKRSAHGKEMSWLEIKTREEELREELFEYVTIVSRA